MFAAIVNFFKSTPLEPSIELRRIKEALSSYRVWTLDVDEVDNVYTLTHIFPSGEKFSCSRQLSFGLCSGTPWMSDTIPIKQLSLISDLLDDKCDDILDMM